MEIKFLMKVKIKMIGIGRLLLSKPKRQQRKLSNSVTNKDGLLKLKIKVKTKRIGIGKLLLNKPKT